MRTRNTLLMAAVLGLATLIAPATANAATSAPSPVPAPVAGTSSDVVEVPMTWNCSELTEADRQKAISENINMCGVLDAPGTIQPRGSSNFGCGTAYIYVERWFDKIRVSYSLHSSEGTMIGRSLNVYWQGYSNGSNYDFGGLLSSSYSNSVTGANLPSYQVSESAYMSGSVAIAGWTITCGVWVEDNPGTI